MDEEIETYSPEVEKQVPLPVDSDTTGFEEVTEKDGLIATKLNEKVIIQRIAKDLYKNPSSGLRELYNNSARACRIAIKKHAEEKPIIRISMNEAERKLIISDNGLGLSKERFKKVLLELGTSDNLEAGETGQFGMGFASYMTLSSVVVIDTHARNGDQYKMIAKDGMSFQPVGDADLEGYGTKLTMTCYETVDFPDLVLKLVKIARYSNIPTILELDKFEYFPSGFKRGINKLEQTSFDAEVKVSKTVKQDLIELETDDYHLIALVGMHNNPSNYEHIHLLNVPVESEISMPFDWWVLNIKDERKFKPMPDRDRMTEKADKQLEGLIDKDVKKYFSDLSIHSYKEFLESKKKNEFLWLVEHQDYAPLNLKPVLGNINNCTVRKVVYDTKNFDDGGLVYKLAMNYNIIYQGYKNKNVTEKVLDFEPASMLITTKKTKKNHWKEHVVFMESFGIPTARQILIDNKVKIPKMEKSEIELIGHTNNSTSYYEHEMVDLDDIDENFIRVDTVPMVDMIRYVKQFQNPYTFVRNASELDEYDSRDYSEWLKNDVPNIVCATNDGALTIKELAEVDTEVIFCDDFIPEYESFLKQDDRIVVYGTTGLLPLALYKNPECPEPKGLRDIPSPVVHGDFDTFVSKKHNVFINNDELKKIFCDNLNSIKPCFHKLFANLLSDFDNSTKPKEKERLIKIFVDRINGLPEFDETDVVASVRFYHEQTDKNKEAVWIETFQNLRMKAQYKIMETDDSQARLLKELILPKIFGHVEFRRMVKEPISYNTAYSIDIATHDREFDFKDDMEVYGFNLQFRGVKIRVNKGYCSLTMLVYINK